MLRQACFGHRCVEGITPDHDPRIGGCARRQLKRVTLCATVAPERADAEWLSGIGVVRCVQVNRRARCLADGEIAAEVKASRVADDGQRGRARDRVAGSPQLPYGTSPCRCHFAWSQRRGVWRGGGVGPSARCEERDEKHYVSGRDHWCTRGRTKARERDQRTSRQEGKPHVQPIVPALPRTPVRVVTGGVHRTRTSRPTLRTAVHPTPVAPEPACEALIDLHRHLFGVKMKVTSRSRRPARARAFLPGVLAVLAVCADPAVTPPDPPPPTPIVTVSITGHRLRGLRLGDTLALQARVQTSDTTGGSTAPDPVTWSVSDSGMVQVSREGVVRALASGYARVRAHAGTATDSLWVRVEEARPVTPLFHFEFDATVSAVQQRAALRAAARWARIVRAPLDSLVLDLAPNACTGALVWPRAVVGPETGVRVLVTSARSDWPAGTVRCEYRLGGTSAVSLIAISTDPLYAWYDEATWTTIWIHELGHALGLAGDLVQAAGTRVTTPGFVAGYAHDHGRLPTDVVWDQRAHWGGLPGDIMDGNTGPARATVIGRATVGRLLDMGYPVDLRQSGPLDLDAFNTGAAQPAAAMASEYLSGHRREHALRSGTSR